MYDWDDIKLFLAVAEHGSVSEAARSLGLNHSTVSRRIHKFEEQIGFHLMERVAGGYSLTASGEVFLSACDGLKPLMNHIARQAAALDESMRGTLKLTCSDLMASMILMPHIMSFSELYSELKFEIDASDQMLSLTKREADVAIRAVRTPPDDLIGKKLVGQSVCVYGTVKWRDVFPRDWIVKDKLEVLEAMAKPEDRIVLSSPSKLARFSAARAGLGLAMLPCRVADTAEELVRYTKPTAGLDIWLLYHPDLKRSMRVRSFADYIVDVFQKQKDLFEPQA